MYSSVNKKQNKRKIFFPSIYTADDGVRGLSTRGESKGGTGSPRALNIFDFFKTINNTFKALSGRNLCVYKEVMTGTNFCQLLVNQDFFYKHIKS